MPTYTRAHTCIRTHSFPLPLPYGYSLSPPRFSAPGRCGAALRKAHPASHTPPAPGTAPGKLRKNYVQGRAKAPGGVLVKGVTFKPPTPGRAGLKNVRSHFSYIRFMAERNACQINPLICLIPNKPQVKIVLGPRCPTCPCCHMPPPHLSLAITDHLAGMNWGRPAVKGHHIQEGSTTTKTQVMSQALQKVSFVKRQAEVAIRGSTRLTALIAQATRQKSITVCKQRGAEATPTRWPWMMLLCSRATRVAHLRASLFRLCSSVVPVSDSSCRLCNTEELVR